MSKPFALDRDKHSHGGYVMAAQTTDNCTSRAFVCEGDSAVCQVHGSTRVASASSHLFIDGRCVALDGDKLACGAVIIASGDHASCN